MTMAEKIIARNLVGHVDGQCVKPHDPVIAQVQGGYSHEFTTAQVHTFLSEEYGEDYQLPNPDKFASSKTIYCMQLTIQSSFHTWLKYRL